LKSLRNFDSSGINSELWIDALSRDFIAPRGLTKRLFSISLREGQLWGIRVTVDRRRMLQLALGGGTLSAFALPDRWVRPVVTSVIVPAHAQASPPARATTTTTTASSD
jgi:hypothetical protein